MKIKNYEFRTRPGVFLCFIAMLSCLLLPNLSAQNAQPQASRSPKAMAPIDLTGYWVALVTEDWRYRMTVPPKGDYASVPLNAAGKKMADKAAVSECKAYGAPALMRIPGRLHVTWSDDNTVKVETDAGSQTRLLHFGSSQAGKAEATLQGNSVASWDMLRGGAAGAGGGLRVITTNMRPGYLRSNGVPYSANTRLTEYYDVVKEANGDQYLIVTNIVDDPTYLLQPFITSSHFRKQPDAAGWAPSPCEAE